MAGKKLLLFGFIVVLLVVIPLTVYLVQQQQKLGAGAAPSTVLSFIPSSKSVSGGEAFTLDVNMAPGGNEVSFIKLSISFDPAKLELNPLGGACSVNSNYVICPNSTIFPGTPLQGPTVGSNNVSITLSVGSNPANAIKASTKLATIGFKAKDSSGTTTVSYGSDSQVLSIANADQFNENVLLNSQTATITIAGGAASPSPSGSPAASPSSQVSCSSFTADKAATGTVPWAVNFQAVGNTTNATITKATFNWGDAQSEDVQAATPNANVTINKNHTYNNSGSFTSNVVFTDSLGRVSAVGNCTKTFTISASASASPTPTGAPASGGTTTGGTSTTQIVTVTAAPSATPEATPAPTSIAVDTTKGGLEAPGPGDEILSFGGLGILTVIIGGLLLFGL